MIESPPRLSAPALAHAKDTYTHCIQYLLLRWFNLPTSIPEQEAVEVRGDIQRLTRFLLDELEIGIPGTRDNLLYEMRGLADLLASPISGKQLGSLMTPSDPIGHVGVPYR